MPPVTDEPELGDEEAGDFANYEKGRPPDEIYEDDRMDTSSRRFPSDSMSKSAKVFDKDSEERWPLASRKGKRKLDSEEIYPRFLDGFQSEDEETGKAKHALRLQRAWVVQSVWASIENVFKISSSVLVNELQCKHIADHFKVITNVLEKLGLDKDFVSGQALDGGNGVQTNLAFDEMHFNRVAKTFKKLHFNEFHFEDIFWETRIRDVSSMFKDYIRELPALDGSSEESLSKQFKINQGFQDFSFLGMSIIENVEARSPNRRQYGLDEFLCLLLGVLKQGEDLVLFHLGLEGANNEVVQRTGLYGEKFVRIHELLYKLLGFYACLEHCEGTKFAWGYLSRLDSCRAQSFHYYLNSNCLDKMIGLDIKDEFLNVERATRILELLERPNCAVKSLYIGPCSGVKVDEEELRKCRLLVIVALSKCVSLTHLSIDGSNGEEVHELCNSLSGNEVLETLHLSIDGPLADNHAMDLSTMLKENHSLKSFSLVFKGTSHEGAIYLGAMLAENSSFKKMDLTYRVLDEIDLKHLLMPLEASSDQEPYISIFLNPNGFLTLFLELPTGIVEMIAQILSMNKTLTHFSIHSLDSNPDVVCAILDSLKKNKTLEVLDLGFCKELDYAHVKQAFVDLLFNYNFSLSTIKMRGKNWNIEPFIKCILFESKNPNRIGDLWSNIGGTSESPIIHNAYDLNQVLEDFQLEKGEGSVTKMHRSFMKAFKEYQEEFLVGHLSKPREIFGLQSKLEAKSQQSLQELKPLLELVMKSTNLLLRRNLNMAQFLQKRYIEWNSFVGMYPSELTDEEKDEFNKGCITAALFPKTFLYHLKARLLQGPNLGGILYTLKEVSGLVVLRIKSFQDLGSQTFQFINIIDFRAPLDVEHIYSPTKTIAICQTFSTRTQSREELQVENSIQYGIVQDHFTGVYYFESEKSSDLDKPNFDKSTGVIGVKVTSTEIQVEIMWEDGSYYLGALENFSYDLELDDNKQCAYKAFGDLKGAHFLRTHGLKCSPLVIIALAMAIHKKGLTLTWSNGKGHIDSNLILPFLQPMELEVWECQILFGGDTNQLGEAVEWGMNQFSQNCVSVFRLDLDPNQKISTSCDSSIDTWSSDESNDTSNHTPNNVDLGVLATQFNAGAQSKLKANVGVRILGFGAEVGGEIKDSKGKKVEDQAFKKLQDFHWEEEGGYVSVGNLDDKHRLLEERLFQGSLYAEPELNYLVVYDHYKESHVSIYWVKERNDKPRLELKWVTDIFVKGGLERIKKIFEGLKGETLEVTRRYTKFHENPSQQQSKGFMKWFANRLSNKESCKDNALQMVFVLEGLPHPIPSNDEWKHIIGLQDNTHSNQFWWKASYMQAITYSRTIYSSGILLSTHTTMAYGLKCGRARRKFRHGKSSYVHDIEVVKSYAKFSKPPQSLSSKWHEMIYWGGLK